MDRDCYRGITITPTLSKILEHIVLNRVIDGLTQNPLQLYRKPLAAVVSDTTQIADSNR